MLNQLSNLFKLRIGIIMSATAVAALVVTPGQPIPVWEVLVLAVSVLLAAGSAGAFNQYFEWDLDRHMQRTCNRPFVTGTFQHNRWWLLLILLLLLAGVAGAGFALNGMAALHIFLGAFFYAIVYTVWLKRRTWINIVIGGAAGSFAVLAGASVVDPSLSPIPIILAVVLFLWTPSHFWSLAIARHGDYAAAGVPMLPVVVGDHAAAKVALGNTLALVTISILPFFFGLGWIYLAGAVAGGGYFLYRNLQMVQEPTRKTAMSCFFASLIQLAILLTCAVLDVKLLG
ncbi:MAG: protoheme IX farnesyltransferase [Gammaproteobacteria bacterium]|nr:protoheme IX farnesyltransferase [Gammaproteobacteria bacterium]